MEINNSNNQILKGFDLFQGLADMEILAINPTKQQLKDKLGIDANSEPQYKDLDLSKDGNLQNKVVFYLKTNCMVKQLDGSKKFMDVPGRAEFFMKPIDRLGKESGNPQIVDSKGNFNWVSIERMKEEIGKPDVNPTRKKILEQFIENIPYHNAIVGEEQVVDFLKNYFNQSPLSDFDLDMKKIASLDFSELLPHLNQAMGMNNKVTVLLGVTEKGFQAVYNKKFSRPTAKSSANLFNKALAEQYGSFNADFGNDFTLRLYEGKAKIDSPDTANTSALSDFTVN